MIDLTNFENVPPCLVSDPEECSLAVEVFEHATFLSVEREDIQEFDRNISVVRCYYDEFASILPASKNKNAIIGLYLLYLLSFNK